MSEEQIENMACIMCGNQNICVGEGVEKCILYPKMRRYAYRAYRKGYRKQEWISVDERLPDKGGKYIVYREFCNGLSLINIINYDPNYDGHAMWFLFDGEWGDCEVNNVTHWMPLPEPPKMKGHENG